MTTKSTPNMEFGEINEENMTFVFSSEELTREMYWENPEKWDQIILERLKDEVDDPTLIEGKWVDITSIEEQDGATWFYCQLKSVFD